MCVSNKKFSTMSNRSSSVFAKIKKRCYEKNSIFQSYYFTKIMTKKVSKTSCKLFMTLNHDSCNNCDANSNIVIVCCDFLLNVTIFLKTL